MIIEKNIPLPPRRSGHKPKHPFGIMDIGDSVFFDNEPRGSQSSQAICARNYGLNHKKKFTCRAEGDGVRIWRTA